MPQEAIFCVAHALDLANQIVARLKTSGFSINNVSALIPDQDNTRDAQENGSTHPRLQPPSLPQTAWSTARRNGFACIGTLAIPEIGPIVAAGPIIFALSGAVVGDAGRGGLAGALVGMGVSASEASRYEGKVKEGHILISVQAENSSEVPLVKTIFREAGAQCVCATDQAALPDGSATASPITD